MVHGPQVTKGAAVYAGDRYFRVPINAIMAENVPS